MKVYSVSLDDKTRTKLKEISESELGNKNISAAIRYVVNNYKVEKV